MSQIKVPVTLPSQPVSKTLLTSNQAVTGNGSGDPKRRKIEVVNRRSNNIAIVNNGPHQTQPQKAKRLITTSANTVTTQIVVEDASVSIIG